MGIKGLTKIIEDIAPSAIQKNPGDLRGKKVAIDTSVSLYQFLTKQPGEEVTNGIDTSYLLGMFERTKGIIDNGMFPVYVFDGNPPDLKAAEVQKRMDKRISAKEALDIAMFEGDEEEIEKQSRRLFKVNANHVENCKKLFDLMGVPWVDAPSEAEAQCAELLKKGKVDFVATEDMDALAFGSSVLLRHFTFNVDRKTPITQFSLKKFQEIFNVTHDQFIDFCILLGCDYCEKISGIGPKNAIKLILEHKSIENIIQNLEKKKYKIPIDWKFREARQLFKNPEVIPGENIDLVWNPMDEKALIQFLCSVEGFEKEIILKIFGSNAPCKRCLVIPGPGNEKCYVPHPEYHLEEHESCFSGGECKAKYFCNACDSEFTRQWNRKQGLGTAKIVGGKMWCFKGNHNTQHLVQRDLRRNRNDVVVLDTEVNVENTSAKLQEAINCLNNTGNAIVKITDHGFDEPMKSIRFNISMEQLVDLQLMDIQFSEIILNQTRTPNLQELFLHNVPEDCRMEILLPTLKKFKMFYYQGPEDDSWINPMLECAKQLEAFETYKLGAQGCLKFASNFLTKINLHRAECLDSLVVYAPRLEKLSLQACYSMDGQLTFLKTYPGLSEEMPENHEPPVCEVIITNANVSPTIMRTLKNNPKCRIVNEDSQGPLGSEQFQASLFRSFCT